MPIPRTPVQRSVPIAISEAKDTIEGVISINKNTASKLSKWSSHSCHDRCGNVESVFGDRVVVSLDI